MRKTAECQRGRIHDDVARRCDARVRFLCSQNLPLAVLLFLAVSIAGCRQEMFDQPVYKPLASSDFFENGASARPLPAHTIARGHLNEDTHLHNGRIGDGLAETFPFSVTREVLDRGRERFDIFCSVCHGRRGEGNGMIVQRGFPAPPSFHIERLRDAPPGHAVDVITRGYGVMFSYAARVPPADRWAIAAYIQALQLSRNGGIEDVPPSERANLESSSVIEDAGVE